MSGASGLRPHDHSSAGSGGTIAGIGTPPATLTATLTNKSGGGVIAGDVVILGTANDDSFTTTTSAASTSKVGIAAETIANNAAGKVVIAGYVALVNVTASVTRGDFLFTSTTVKKASGSATFAAGAFGVVAKAGTSPTAIVFAHTDQGGGGGSAQFDDDMPSYRFPTGFEYLRQEDPGDGSDAYVDLIAGEVIVQARGSTGSGNKRAFLDLIPSGRAQLAGELDVVLGVDGTAATVVLVEKGLQFPAAPSDPASPAENTTYYNTTSHVLRTYDGTSWHDVPGSGGASFATPSVALGSSAAAGAASTVIRSDSTIAAFDATSPTTQAIGDSAVVGTAAFAARRDHKHAVTNPLTTQDDLWVGGASGAPARLAKGTDSQVLTVDPGTHHLVWATPSSGFSDPMTSRGDIIVRNSSNTTARLAKGSADTYLGSDGTDVSYSAVTDAKLSTSDVTTNNVSIAKHGFAPKAPNDATKYLDGTGAYSTPAGGGGSSGYDLDTYSLDGTYGDDFTGGSLDAKWTRRNYTSGAETYAQGKNATYLQIAHAGRAAGDGYFQDATSLPDGTYAMAFVPHFYSANGIAFGIAILDSAGTGVATVLYSGGPQALILAQVTTYSTYGGSYVQVGASGTAPNVSVLTNGVASERKMWVYISRTGTSHKTAVSFDGELWTPESGSLTWAGTPRYIGMFQGPLGSVTTGTGLGTYADVDWFNKIA